MSMALEVALVSDGKMMSEASAVITFGIRLKSDINSNKIVPLISDRRLGQQRRAVVTVEAGVCVV